ncbi:hypothetical protein [Mycolicibacterium thermoresistibile]
MLASIRPYATAGVALVGAGVIAVTPVAPPPADIQVSRQAVALSAISNPGDPVVAYGELIANTIGSLQGLGGQFAADPAPVLVKILQNQIANGQLIGSALDEALGFLLQGVEALPGALEEAFALLTQGDLKGAVDAFMMGIIPAALGMIVPLVAGSMIITNTADNFARAVSAVLDVDAMLPTLLGFAGPVLSAVDGFVTSGQAVLDGVLAGDPIAVLNAVASTPAVLIDAVLNGSGTLLGFLPLPGLLTPATAPIGGPIATLLGIRNAIADALQPVEQDAAASAAAPMAAKAEVKAEEEVDAVAAVTSVPGENFRTVNLTTELSTAVENPVAGEPKKSAAVDGVPTTVATEEATTGATESLDPAAATEGDDGLEDDSAKNANGGTDLSDGNKATPATTAGDTSADSGSNKAGQSTLRAGVKKATAKASAASSTGGSDE